MYIKQISVYLENNTGSLRALTKTLAEKHIDMLALSIADTTNFGIARLVVRSADIEPAVAALREQGFVAKTTAVVGIAVANVPGGLDGALAAIESKGLPIEYMYSLNAVSGSNALMVLRLTAPDEQTDVATLLADSGITLVAQEDVDKL